MRIWMTEQKSYWPPIPLNDVMRAGGIGEVVESKNARLPVGAWVGGMTGVTEEFITEGKGYRVFDPRALPDPFIVAATQNPIEYEGTYQLPEAQLDRFLLKLNVPLPPRDQEVAILSRHAHGFDPRDLSAIRPVAGPAELAAGREAVRQVLVADEVLGYIVDIAGATRNSPALNLGVSPRGATALLATARSWAWLSGRGYVTPDDVKAMAKPTLRHRIALRPEAELEGATADGVLDGILAAVPVPR